MATSIEPSRVQANSPRAGGRSLGVAAIDPIPIFRDGLSSLVHRTDGLHWIGHAASHYAALQLCEQLKPDVVVLDSALDPNCHVTRLLTTGDPALVVVTLINQPYRPVPVRGCRGGGACGHAARHGLAAPRRGHPACPH